MRNTAEVVSLILLSDNLQDLLVDPALLRRADVEIVLADDGGGEPGGDEVVPAYSCLLAARSPFLRDHISSLPAGEKLRLELSELVPGGRHISREALLVILGYIYTGRFEFEVPPPKCVDDACWHQACRPAIDFAIESMYAASGFQIPELVSLYQRRLFEFADMVSGEDMIPIIHAASTCHLSSLLDQCIQKVATSTLNKYLGKQLTGDLYSKIKELCRHSSVDESFQDMILTDHERTVRNIHKALDSDDVNHVSRLLTESAVTLDDAFAIHYAAANCKPKVFAELLKLDLANLNLKDNSGYTPLHVACMRQEPDIILLLLERGACVMESTLDGRDALTICKRLAREKDYNKKLEKHQKRRNAYLCIDILEQERRRKLLNPSSIYKDKTIVTHLLDNVNLLDNVMLSYLELRVALAKSLFPSEAMLAMRVAEADSTEVFTGTNISKRKSVSPNENTTMQNKRLRFDALAKTVELGKWYFPNCSKDLDKIFLKESNDLACELKEEVLMAYDKDTAATAGATSTKSPCSTSRLEMVTLGGSPATQAEGATSDSAHSPALPVGLSNQELGTSGTTLCQQESKDSDVAEDNRFCVESETKLMKSAVWNEIERVKIGDEWKGICRWCKRPLSASTKNGTSHLKRHLDICRPRKVAKARGSSTI